MNTMDFHLSKLDPEKERAKLLKELLQELRIEKPHLEVMAAGYSANIPTVYDKKKGDPNVHTFPVIQISAYLAKRILLFSPDFHSPRSL